MFSKKHIFLLLLIPLLASLAACNMEASKPIPTPNPNVDLSTAWVVNTYLDTFDGVCDAADCSLRDAVYQANATSQDEVFLPRGLYKMNERGLKNDDTSAWGDLDISGRVVIQGEGIDVSVIDGDHQDRIFQVLNGGSLELYDMSLINGDGDTPQYVEPNDSLLDDIVDCVTSLFFGCPDSWVGPPPEWEHIEILDPEFDGGGAIANRGSLVLNDVGIQFSIAKRGGSIFNGARGEATINGGSICNNQARYGGGIMNRGEMTITGAFICSNNLGEDLDAWGESEYYHIGPEPGFGEFDGRAPQFYAGGGGIYNAERATLFVSNSMIRDNAAQSGQGAGILNEGETTIEFTQILLNHGDGIFNRFENAFLTIRGDGSGRMSISGNKFAAIDNEGTASILGALISENGNGISNSQDGLLKVEQSTLSQHLEGAGIQVFGGNVQAVNVSLRDNLNGVEIGFISNQGFLHLLNVTLYGNETGIHNLGGGDSEVRVNNVIIADNTQANCIGTIISLGNNIDSENSCGFNVIGDQVYTDPLIDSASAHQLLLLSGSPAIDAGSDDHCASIDQQGEVRPSGLACDIGADEFHGSADVAIAPPSDNAQPPVTQPVVVAPPDTSTPTNPPPMVIPPTTAPPTVTPIPPSPTTHPPTPTLTPTATSQPDPQNATISGNVWNDANGNGVRDSGEFPLALVTIKLGSGSCNATGLDSVDTNFGGGYTFKGLAAGTYCVSVDRAESCGSVSSATTPKQVTVVLSPSQSFTVSFGLQKTVC